MAHPIPWLFIVCFILWIINNLLLLNHKVYLGHEDQQDQQYKSIARLYPKGTYIPK